MDVRQYQVYIKHRFGWKAESWAGFFRTYDEIPTRRKLISVPDRGYILDQYTGGTLSLNDGIDLLFRYEFTQCTDFVDWELFIDTYKEFQDDGLIAQATNNLRVHLLDADLLIILHQYVERFPGGLFISEAKAKIALLVREEEYKEYPPAELSEVERKLAVADVKKVVKSIVKDSIGNNRILELPEIEAKNDNRAIIKFFEDKKITIATESIEKILKDVLDALPSLKVKKDHADGLISISASFKEWQRKVRHGLITPQAEQIEYQMIIHRILEQFNFIIADL